VRFRVYTSQAYRFNNFKKIGAKTPYVYIDTTPNENNMYDCFVFNAPMLKRISFVGIFKDLR